MPNVRVSRQRVVAPAKTRSYTPWCCDIAPAATPPAALRNRDTN